MHDLHAALDFLQPWEFSPTVFLLCVGAVLVYLRGLRRAPAGAVREGFGRKLGYFTGWALIYFVMQTHWDYLSQHMFFIHRLQHLVLHHIGPFLIVLSQPLTVLARGLPSSLVDHVVRPVWRHPVTRLAYRALQNWLVAPLLFVGLIYLWLYPPIHFDAMLSDRLYLLMNWSMLIDGFLFWSLVLDPRSRQEGASLGFGSRVFLVLAAALPQVAIGAYIGVSHRVLYSVYSVCGRAWPISPLEDQSLGGLITWIPPAMMHTIAALILLGRWMRTEQGTTPDQGHATAVGIAVSQG